MSDDSRAQDKRYQERERHRIQVGCSLLLLACNMSHTSCRNRVCVLQTCMVQMHIEVAGLSPIEVIVWGAALGGVHSPLDLARRASVPLQTM